MCVLFLVICTFFLKKAALVYNITQAKLTWAITPMALMASVWSHDPMGFDEAIGGSSGAMHGSGLFFVYGIAYFNTDYNFFWTFFKKDFLFKWTNKSHF